MSTTDTYTPPTYRVPFNAKNSLFLIKSYSALGTVIEVDPTCKYACAVFDNLIDFNEFQDVLKKFGID